MENAELMPPGGLLLIAEFARRCRLPVSTLRYYDRVGLLRPAAVDRNTGYRRYGPDQVPAALVIGRLRAIGTAPDVIARVLSGGVTAAAALAAERRRLTAEISDRRDALTWLDNLSHAPPGGGCPRDVDLPRTRVVAREFTAPFPDLAAGITRSIAALRARLRHHGTLTRSPGWGALLPGAPDDLALSYRSALARLDDLGRRPGPVVIEDYPPASPDGGARPIRITVPVECA